MFVAERDTGKILGFEVQSGALLTQVETGFFSIGGLSFSPTSKVLHFVDEKTNTLNAIKVTSACSNQAPSRVSGGFDAEVIRARDSINGQAGRNDFFSLFHDYECTVDSVIPDAVYFDQVHDTGYASDNPDVQAMAGMDETAALLANRTDCGATSELNFDQLLLGGYYCHQCLPDGGAECDPGGVCTNILWLGYVCDNEFHITQDSENGAISVTTSNKTLLEEDNITLESGVVYRFTVQLGEDKPVCIHDTSDSSSTPLLLPGNTAGCATRGPLLVTAGNDLPEKLFLHTSDGMLVSLLNERGFTVDNQNPASTVFTSEPNGPQPFAEEQKDATTNVGLIVAIAVACFVGIVLIGLFGVYFLQKKKREKPAGVEEAPTMNTTSM